MFEALFKGFTEDGDGNIKLFSFLNNDCKDLVSNLDGVRGSTVGNESCSFDKAQNTRRTMELESPCSVEAPRCSSKRTKNTFASVGVSW